MIPTFGVERLEARCEPMPDTEEVRLILTVVSKPLATIQHAAYHAGSFTVLLKQEGLASHEVHTDWRI